MVKEEVVDVDKIARLRDRIVVGALGQFFPNLDLCLALFVQLDHVRWSEKEVSFDDSRNFHPSLWKCLGNLVTLWTGGQ